MELVFKIVLFLYVLVCFMLIISVLLQKTTDEGMLISTSSNSFMSSIEVVDFAVKFTRYLACVFIFLTLTLGAIATRISKSYSLINETAKEEKNSQVPLD